MAPTCLINTNEDFHAYIEGLTTSKVKKIPPPSPPKLGHCDLVKEMNNFYPSEI